MIVVCRYRYTCSCAYVLSTGPICMVMEYMCHGDLLGFLRATRGHDNMYTVLPGMKETPRLKLTSRDLLNIITQVASGMHFLSENKVGMPTLVALAILAVNHANLVLVLEVSM